MEQAGTNVYIRWRADRAECGAEIDGMGITFEDGYAVFHDMDEEGYKIPLTDLIEIGFI